MENYKIACLGRVFFALLFFCGLSSFANAELITHDGLPNREGVKADPLGSGLGDADLPNRKGVKIPPFTVHSAFNTEVQFDTNIFLEDNNPKFDVITILNPTVGAELPFSDNLISIDYDFSANIFGRYYDESFADHRLRGLLEINWTDFKLNVADIYRFFSDRSGTEDVDRIERQNNYMRAGIATTGFEQLEADVGYTFGIEDFRAKDIIYIDTSGNTMTYNDKDRYLNVFDASVSYRFLPKTSVIAREYLGFIDYPSGKNSDSWYTETMVGLKGDFREDFSMNIFGGFKYQDYSDGSLVSEENYAGPVVRGGFTYSITKDDKFDVLLERNIYESTFSNENYYNVNHAGLNYTHYFNRKLSGRVFGYYQLNLYPSDALDNGESKKRHDHIFGGGVGLRYDIQEWSAIEVRYGYKQKESNFGTFDYIDNLVSIRASVGF
ncbi:MAG: outer membrane beta-barrel protein [Candidatus Omnitrophica bacterium]|nr:outer membrane beta-barrel protein [Candidatus Omnitrophota bacterium]